MDVLHLYSGNLYGGIERLLETLAQCREACPELSPHFGLCFDGRVAGQLRQAGVPVHLLGEVRVRQPWTIWKARRRLSALLATTSFDAVLTHAAWPHAVFGPAVRSAGLPLINWIHDIPNGKHWIERWASRTPPHRVLANSHCTLAAAPKLFSNVAGEVCYCPVPAPKLKPGAGNRETLRNELSNSGQDVVILTACRFEPYKGHESLLRSLGPLRDMPNWTCWIAGGAQRPHEVIYRDQLQQLAIDLKIDHRIRFLGQRSDIAQLMAAADIHCQPNIGPEPFGIAFVEALYAGLPVVTSAMGGAVEIVDDTCGVLLPPGDANELTAALRQLIESPDLRRRLGAGGPARACMLCDPAKGLGQLHRCLQDVVQKAFVHA